MIIEDVPAVAAPVPAPEEGADFVSWIAESVGGITDAGEAAMARLKLQDACDELARGEKIMEQFLTDCLQRGMDDVAAGELAWRSIRDSAIGNGERLTDQGEAAMAKAWAKIQDFAYWNMTEAFNRMGDAGVLVATSNGAVDTVLAAPHASVLDAIADYRPVGEVSEDTGIPLSSPESGPVSAVPVGVDDDTPLENSAESVVNFARQLAASIPGNPSAVVLPPSEGLPPCPDGSQVPYLGVDPRQFGIELPGPISAPGNIGETLKPYFSFLNHGFVLIGTEIQPAGAVTDGSIRWTFFRSSDQFRGYVDVAWTTPGTLNGYPYRQPFPLGLPGVQPQWLAQANGAGVTLEVPQPCTGQPPTSPPTSPPPPETSPPPPEPLPATCCPPDPVERDEFRLRKPVVPAYSALNTNESWCVTINTLVNALGCGGGTAGDTPGSNPDPNAASNWWAGLESSGGTRTDAYMPSQLRWMSKPVAGGTTEGIVNTLAVNQAMTKEWVEKITPPAGVSVATIACMAGMEAAKSWAETISGAPVKYLGRPQEHAFKYLVPVELPGQSDIDSLWLTGKADDAEWECLTRSQGNLPTIHRRVRDGKTAIPNVAEQVELFMRKYQTDVDLKKELRRLGVTDENDIYKWIELRMQIPQFADIIRFMVRDVENDAVVQKGQFDSGFTDNFKGKLKQWAEMNGVSEELALYFWRAHWENPSPTMAYEFIRRLRPGRVDPSLVTTTDDVKQLLAAADYAPGWRDRMIAISYNVPTRTDIKQGYTLGEFKRDEMIESLMDTGLDRKGAEFVGRLYDREKEMKQRALAGKSSAWSIKEALALYVDGILREDEARFVLDKLGMGKDAIDSSLASAELKRIVRERQECTKAIRRQYFLGIIDRKEAVTELVDKSFDRPAAIEIVNQWECQRAAALQEVPARKNLDWAVSGVISLAELDRRLTNLRYQPDDVARYVAEATQRISQALAKAAEKALREELANRRRNLAELRRQIADLEKKKKELEKANQGDKGGGKG